MYRLQIIPASELALSNLTPPTCSADTVLLDTSGAATVVLAAAVTVVPLVATTVVLVLPVVTTVVPVEVGGWVVDVDALQVLADNQASTTKVTVK